MHAWHESLSNAARRRVQVYPLLFLAGYLVLGGVLVLGGEGRVDRFGKPVGGDFVTFYAASVLVCAGDASRSYDLGAIAAVEREVIGAPIGACAFHYPPPVLALIAPLSLLPYSAALTLFTLLSVAAFAYVVWRAAHDRLTRLVALSAPAFFQTLLHGQNGAFTTLLFFLGCSLLASRPLVAGAVLGGLACKPHFLPFVVLALLVTRRLRALSALLASACVLVLASFLVLGEAPWRAFIANLPLAARLASSGALPLHKMPTVTAALLLLGAPASVALALQLVACGAAALALVAILRGALPESLACAAVAAATLFGLPFAFEYDWVLSVLPLLWLCNGTREPSRGDLTLWAVVWLAPILWAPLARAAHVQLGPWLASALLLRVAVRARGYPLRGEGNMRSATHAVRAA